MIPLNILLEDYYNEYSTTKPEVVWLESVLGKGAFSFDLIGYGIANVWIYRHKSVSEVSPAGNLVWSFADDFYIKDPEILTQAILKFGKSTSKFVAL